ncbi:hypothetical protein K1719_016622 [Acacia pycnantha]|nr:hypothetical protein K1719_016622 [Acacia pycnantha]
MTQNLGDELLPKLCEFLYADNETLVTLLQQMRCWIFKQYFWVAYELSCLLILGGSERLNDPLKKIDLAISDVLLHKTWSNKGNPCFNGTRVSFTGARALMEAITSRNRANFNGNIMHGHHQDVTSKKLLFPLMALLLVGILGGVFRIGGGMLISSLLLQVGIASEITAATSSFMVIFSSTMSTLQYALMGIHDINKALILSTISFVASLVGLLVVQRAVRKYKRASLIVFSLSATMALNIVLMTSFGVIGIWRDYKSGKYIGFKSACKKKQPS